MSKTFDDAELQSWTDPDWSMPVIGITAERFAVPPRTVYEVGFDLPDGEDVPEVGASVEFDCEGHYHWRGEVSAVDGRRVTALVYSE